MSKDAKKPRRRPPIGKSAPADVVGWREKVSFPEWGIEGILAKIDTGARTSALHVENIQRMPRDRVRFHVVVRRRDPFRSIPVRADLVRVTRVRSSTGHQQERFVVATLVRIGGIERRIEMSLVQREHLLCRMLLGRTALEGLLVDPGRKHVASRRRKRAVAE